MPAPRRDEITDHLRERILSGLHLGLLSCGDRLPGVRALAREFGVNVRVVLAACEQLAAESLVEVRDRSGIYVPAEAALGPGSAGRRGEWLTECLLQGLEHGIPAPELGEHVRRAVSTLRLHALVVDSNQDQLWSMTDELRRDYGVEASAVDLDELDPDAPPAPDLLRADLVVSTSFHAHQAQQIAARLEVPCHAVTMCTHLFAEVARLLEREPVYFVVSDPRFAARLEQVFSASPGAARLRLLVLGRDDPGQVPPGAPVYLTRLTRSRMPGSPLLARGMPEERVFSSASSREIMGFVVRANLAARARGPAGR